MKKSAVFLFAMQFALHAQTIHIAGQTFGIAFDDATLSATNRTIIANDVVRLLAPSTNSAKYIVKKPPSPEGYAGFLNFMSGPNYYPKTDLPSDIKPNATNGLDIIVTKDLSDEYLGAIAMLQTYPGAVAKADAFTALIITNTVANIPLTQLNAMLLTKDSAPGTFSSSDLEQVKTIYANINFCMPSLLGFHVGTKGPNNGTYLWNVLPVLGDTSEIPIIYYQNQWRISWWFMEPGEQTW